MRLTPEGAQRRLAAAQRKIEKLGARERAEKEKARKAKAAQALARSASKRLADAWGIAKPAKLKARRTETASKVTVPIETLLDVLKYLDGVEICNDADWNAVEPLRTKIRACLAAAVPK